MSQPRICDEKDIPYFSDKERLDCIESGGCINKYQLLDGREFWFGSHFSLDETVAHVEMRRTLDALIFSITRKIN